MVCYDILKNKIFKLFLNLTRDSNIQLIRSEFNPLIEEIYDNYYKEGNAELSSFLLVLYKLIGQTRDKKIGKGEYFLSYVLLYDFYKYFPALSMILFNKFITENYGSWKDIKLFCEYCRIEDENPKCNKSRENFIDYAITITNGQLQHDLENMAKGEPISNVSKWIPREKTKYKWIFEKLAFMYFQEYFKNAKSKYQKICAQHKAKRSYRLLISNLNRYNLTIETLQCEKKWSNISLTKLTSQNIGKYAYAFLNITKDGSKRNKIDDRTEFTKKFFNYVLTSDKIPSSQLSLDKIIGGLKSIDDKIFDLKTSPHEVNELLNLKYILNKIWECKNNKINPIPNSLVLLDTSYDITVNNKLNSALGIALQIIEKSSLPKRILTFGNDLKWINLENKPLISDKLLVLNNEVNLFSDLKRAIDLLLDSLKESECSNESIKCLKIFVILNFNLNNKNIVNEIEMSYKEKKIELPTFIFWNLNGHVDNIKINNNFYYLSGVNTNILNMFSLAKHKHVKPLGGYESIEKILSHKRYQCLEDEFQNYFK